MKLHSDLPVYKSTYDLLLGIFEFTKGFSKEYKYTVGESLKKETIDLLILIYRVNTRQDKGAVLEEAKEGLTPIVCFVPLGFFSRFYKLPFHRPLETKTKGSYEK